MEQKQIKKQEIMDKIQSKSFVDRVLRRTFSEGNPEGKYSGGAGLIEVDRTIESFQEELKEVLK